MTIQKKKLKIYNKKINQEEIRHFSKLKHIWWGAQTQAGQKRYDYKFNLLKKLCNLKPGARILEIGCGDGEFTKRLIRLDMDIIATDITPRVISRAEKENKSKKVKFHVANAERLNFKANSFDLVCGVSILHHLNLEKTISEIERVLKKGGYLFFTEPNLLNPQVFLGLNIPFLRKRMEFSPSERAFYRWDIEKKFNSAGFRNVEVNNYDFLHPNTPYKLIPFVKNLSDILEKIPLIKEISGSLYIVGVK